MKLNIGCGTDYRRGWVNVDAHEGDGVKPDVKALAHVLPMDAGTVTHIYAAHVLEHVIWSAVPDTLAEFRRVMVPGGRLCVVGPNVARMSWHPSDEDYRRVMFGTNRWDFDQHQWPCSSRVLWHLLYRAGFTGIEVFESPIPRHVVSEWRVSDPELEWQCAVLCTKEG